VCVFVFFVFAFFRVRMWTKVSKMRAVGEAKDPKCMIAFTMNADSNLDQFFFVRLMEIIFFE
jgi:hypothetical protein